MTPRALIGRLRHRLSPQVVIAILFLGILAYTVVLPLIVMLQETFLVHPMERFQVPGQEPGTSPSLIG